MATHLYGDLPKSKNKQLDSEGSAAAWSDVAKAPSAPSLPSAPAQKTPSVPAATPLAPPSVVKKQNRHVPLEIHVGHRETEGLKYGFSLFGDVENEYDPAKPNDYEAVMQERERKRREAELEAEKQERLLHQRAEEKAVEFADVADRRCVSI